MRYGIVEGMDVRDSRAHNYPPRWNAAPNQDLLVIRRNQETGAVSLDALRWGLIPHWCTDPTGGRRPPLPNFGVERNITLTLHATPISMASRIKQPFSVQHRS